MTKLSAIILALIIQTGLLPTEVFSQTKNITRGVRIVKSGSGGLTQIYNKYTSAAQITIANDVTATAAATCTGCGTISDAVSGSGVSLSHTSSWKGGSTAAWSAVQVSTFTPLTMSFNRSSDKTAASSITVSGGNFSSASTSLPSISITGSLTSNVALSQLNKSLGATLASNINAEAAAIGTMVSYASQRITAFNASNSTATVTSGSTASANIASFLSSIKAEIAAAKSEIINPALGTKINYTLNESGYQYTVNDASLGPMRFYTTKTAPAGNSIVIDGVSYTPTMVSIGRFKKSSIEASTPSLVTATSSSDIVELFVANYQSVIPSNANLVTLGTSSSSSIGSYSCTNPTSTASPGCSVTVLTQP